jgi:hypothetical protein
LTRGLIVKAALVIAGVVVLADVLVRPPAHEVHTPGGTPIAARFFEADGRYELPGGTPSETLAAMSCSDQPCDPVTIAAHYSGLKQSPHTLYMPWARCNSRACRPCPTTCSWLC